MSIDERLGALTQTVELLGHMQIENEKRLEKLSTVVETIAVAQVNMAETIRRMGRYAMVIARDHEARRSALEIDDEGLETSSPG